MTVHALLPADVASRPTGGNRWDLRVCDELVRAGVRVRRHELSGDWPAGGADVLADACGALPDGATVLADGLLGCAHPAVWRRHADRLRAIMIVHLPLALETGTPSAAELDERERDSLAAVDAVIATSPTAAAELARRHGLDPGRIVIAVPGTDPAPPTVPEPAGGRLLCVAAITSRKGIDRLVEALGELADLTWTCTLVGPRDREPALQDRLDARIAELGLDRRMIFRGPLTGDDLAAAYAAADLLVLPSLHETYGMVITEALARAIPVISTAAGTRDALGTTPDGPPGALVDADELSTALRRWLTDPGLRARWRRRAEHRRAGLTDWQRTAEPVLRLVGGSS